MALLKSLMASAAPMALRANAPKAAPIIALLSLVIPVNNLSVRAVNPSNARSTSLTPATESLANDFVALSAARILRI